MKGTSPSQASGEVFTTNQSGEKVEIPANINCLSSGKVMNKITTVVSECTSSNAVTVFGIDLAKNVFALHGVNTAGKAILVRPCICERLDDPYLCVENVRRRRLAACT